MTKSLCAKPIVERVDDLLAGPSLRLARGGLRGWRTQFVDCDPSVLEAVPGGVQVRPTGQGHVEIAQSIRARSNNRYRLDVRAEPARPATDFVAGIQPRFAAGKAEQEIRSFEPPVFRIGRDAPQIHRAVFQCPEGTGRLEIRLRIRACGPIVVRRIRLVESGDYLPAGHVLANAPEPWREAPPCLPDSVLLCDGRRDNRPLLRWLGQVFGREQVRRAAPRPAAVGEAIASGSTALVVDLPAAEAPALSDLVAWSERAIVITSLATFAGAAARDGVAGIQLQDRISGMDLPAALVRFSAYHTRGLALADAVHYAWNDGQDDFAHRYLLVPKPAKARLAEMGIRFSLVTDTGQRDTNKHPLVLYRPGAGGALIVMDPDGLEQPSAGEAVPRVFDLLWGSALGRDGVTLGQFAAPAIHYEGVATDLVELAKHYDTVEDLSIRARTRGQGKWPCVWLWPSRRVDRFHDDRPTLLVRTGFAAGDWPAVYGLMLWLKRVALQSRTNQPAARLLLERMRVLALPIAQPGQWRGCPEGIEPPQIDLLPRRLAGLVDLSVGTDRHTKILVPDGAAATAVRAALGSAMETGVEVHVDPRSFGEEPLVQRRPAGTIACRVVLPGWPQPEPANSPALTDLAAVLLERLAFGPLGWIEANRDWRDRRVDLGPRRRTARRILWIDPAGQARSFRPTHGTVVLRPGTVLVGLKKP